MSETMLRAVATGGAGIDALRFEEAAVPEPGPGEVLVRLQAATLNYRDLIGVHGALPGMTREPDYVPVSCGVGTVAACGPGVTRVVVGQRVSPIFALGWHEGGVENIGGRHLGGQADGVARTHALFDAEDLVLVPDMLGDLEAATLPCAGLTAWSAVVTAGNTRPGNLVVLQGTGGVSIAALQFAKAAGAEVVVTSSSDAKLARARALGADHLVNYRTTPDWASAARDAAGRGADLVVDVVGTAQLEQSAAVCDPQGKIAAVGMLDGGFSWGAQVGVPVLPVTVGSRADYEGMLRAIVANRIRPVVDAAFALDRLPQALRRLEAGDFFGKVGIAIA